MALKKYSYNDNYFRTPNLENSYWAGFIAADGCVYKGHTGCGEQRVVDVTPV